MIYFIETQGLVKIGHSNDPKNRFRNLSTGCPTECSLIGVTEGGEEAERKLHEQFAHLRARGEWFKFTPEINSYLAANAVHVPTEYRRSVKGEQPARTIIDRFGGPNKVSAITGVHRTRVSNWARAKDSGGTGGSIPFRHVPKLLAAAKEQGFDLSADDFLPPASKAKHTEAAGT